MSCIRTSRTDSVVNDVRRVAHDLGALRCHDYGISGGSALYAGLALPSASELRDTEETSLNQWVSRLRTIGRNDVVLELFHIQNTHRLSTWAFTKSLCYISAFSHHHQHHHHPHSRNGSVLHQTGHRHKAPGFWLTSTTSLLFWILCSCY